MRVALIETLMELARDDDRIFLLTGDLGWSVVERFAAEFPTRFLNVGVAEANMAGIAAGLARVGFTPFIYSIATFASMRAYEQVRNGALLHQLPVRVVGIGGGFAYGHAGPTHFALEDLAIARVQPSIATLAPADPAQTRTIIRSLESWSGPAYLRVGKGGNPLVPGLDGRFAFGRPERVLDGREILFLTTGAITHEALIAARELSESGISAAVAVMAHLPFSPSMEFVELLRGFPAVVTVEEGYRTGGLGALAAETIAQYGLACRLEICGVDRGPDVGPSGSECYMRSAHGLSASALRDAGHRVVTLR